MGKRGYRFPPIELLLKRSCRQAALFGRWENPIYFYFILFFEKSNQEMKSMIYDKPNPKSTSKKD